jgi:outer membrane protein insertion porin family
MRYLILPKTGETFSRKKLEQTSEAMKAVLANVGYAFAEVKEVPTINRESKVVDLTLFVDPGKRTYVRRVNFVGNTKTRDEVLRREMRQFEGGWYSKSMVDRSKIRLQRLGFFKEVKIDSQPVAGTDDQVDLKVTVEERTSGSFQFGVGYSANSGIVTSLSLSQENFLGQGNRVGLVLNRNDFFQRYDISYFNPYWTDDGVSRGFNLSYRTLDQGQNNLATYLLDTSSFSSIFSIPVTETDRINLSIGIDRNKVSTDNPPIDSFETRGTPYEFVQQLGDDRSFNALRGSLGWARDTRDRFIFPRNGGYQQIGLNLTLPPSDLRYYKLFYQLQRYFPITESFTFYSNLELGYGDSYGGRFDNLPFFENFYSGGVRSVRGFRENTLGPRLVTNCEDRRTPDLCPLLPVGGAMSFLANLELILPTPAKTADSFRVSAFIDAGNVFSDFSAFEASELRYAAGLSVQWLAPISPQPIQINLAWPLNDKEGDERDGPLQFSFGTNF